MKYVIPIIFVAIIGLLVFYFSQYKINRSLLKIREERVLLLSESQRLGNQLMELDEELHVGAIATERVVNIRGEKIKIYEEIIHNCDKWDELSSNESDTRSRFLMPRDFIYKFEYYPSELISFDAEFRNLRAYFSYKYRMNVE